MLTRAWGGMKEEEDSALDTGDAVRRQNRILLLRLEVGNEQIKTPSI